MTLETLATQERPVTVAVYKKQTNSKNYYMMVTNKNIDIVNNANARKPVIDNRYEIVELGLGGVSMIKTWMKRYGIKKYQFVE